MSLLDVFRDLVNECQEITDQLISQLADERRQLARAEEIFKQDMEDLGCVTEKEVEIIEHKKEGEKSN